jgi:NAD(P)-dependent dehydrogenase (short-subunit alcohol dehydrogenase family)
MMARIRRISFRRLQHRLYHRGMKSDRLRGKVALVTGAGSGIGRGCALMFARHGARVMCTDINADSAAETVELATRAGLGVASTHPIDLARPADVQRLIDATMQRFGRLDVLLNAGGWGAFQWIEDMDFEAHWHKTLACELDVVFLPCKLAWPHLKASGAGSIINIASANSLVALEGSPALAHCAGKGGVLAMTRQLAMEGAPHNIRANSICPGMTVTNATQPVLDNVPPIRDSARRKTMLSRFGQPEDIAWCAVYLASDEAAWVTGADFAIDGGATAW